MALPGLALPEAFQSLDSRLASVIQLCTAKGSPEAQVVGVVSICEELKQLLKCTFIGGCGQLHATTPFIIVCYYYRVDNGDTTDIQVGVYFSFSL